MKRPTEKQLRLTEVLFVFTAGMSAMGLAVTFILIFSERLGCY